MSPEAAGQTYSEVLCHGGWSHTEELGTLTESWHNLIALTRPAVVVAQSAPTALLATPGHDELPKVMFGAGFDAPPRSQPMPLFRFWEKLQRPGKEATVLATANNVLKVRDQPPLLQFIDLLRTDAYLLATFPEIDHYAPRRGF